MNPDALQAIVTTGESETVEFKKSTAQLTRAGETLCALSSLPFGLRLEDLKVAHASRPRNPNLTNGTRTKRSFRTHRHNRLTLQFFLNTYDS